MPRRAGSSAPRKSNGLRARRERAQSAKPTAGIPGVYSVSISNRQRILRVSRRRLTGLVKSLLMLEGVARAELSVAIVNDREIHDVNRRYLGHDYPTDVISFLLDSEPDLPAPKARGKTCAPDSIAHSPRRPVRRGAGKRIDGEIVISAETARNWSARFGNSPDRELDLYLVHGLLHLCGYDDLTPREKRLMRRREAEALAVYYSDG